MSTRIRNAAPRGARRRQEPRKTPIQARARATVENVLSAAAQVFETVGFAAGTTNRIAERAGVSIGTLYQYFPGKEAIAAALAERHVGEMLRGLHAWAGGVVARPAGLRDALRSLVELAMEQHEGEARLHHVLLDEAPLPPRVHAAVRRAEHEAARTVAGVLGLFPEVRRDAPDRACRMAVQIVTSMTHRFAADPGGVSRAAFVAEVADVLEAYLSRPPHRGR